MLFLQFFEHTTGEGAKGLQSSPVEFLLLAQAGVLADQSVMLPIETLAIRALAGFFGHRVASADQRTSWH
jgi:hypothetical protein